MIVGIAGYAGSGKTTVARHLVDSLGYTRLSFATPIRQALMAMGVHESYLTDHKHIEIPRIGHTARYLMQTLGTEWARATVNRNFWLYLMDNAITTQPIGNNIVVDDVRFDNEADYLRRKNGIIINLVRGNTQLDPYSTDHASEEGISSELVNYNIENDGSVAAVVKEMEKIICRTVLKTSPPTT
jgi:cytidylate kinase